MAEVELRVRTPDGQITTLRATDIEVVRPGFEETLELEFLDDGTIEVFSEDGLLRIGPGSGNCTGITTTSINALQYEEDEDSAPDGTAVGAAPYSVSLVSKGKLLPLDLGDATQLVVAVAPGLEVGIDLVPPPTFRGQIALTIPPFDLDPPAPDPQAAFQITHGSANVLLITVMPPLAHNS